MAMTKDVDMEQSPILVQADDSRTLDAGRRPGFVQRLGRSIFAIGLLLAACACIVVLSARDPSPTMSKGSSTKVISLDAIGTVGHAAGSASRFGSNLVEGMGETNTLMKDLHNDVNSSLPHIQGLLDSVRNAKLWFAKRGADFKGKLGKQFAMMRGKNITLPDMKDMKVGPVIPGNDMSDGNSCADDEEMHGKLCYKTCSELTNGLYPKRTTAFSCCKKSPCLFFNQKMNLKICGGFDVSGDSQGGGCPHPLGSCLGNEELHGNLCFKKCSVMTNFTFPYRLAAATCCKVKNIAACLNPKLSNTSGTFNIGGGGTGNLSALTKPHPPMTTFTEAGGFLSAPSSGAASSSPSSAGSDSASDGIVEESILSGAPKEIQEAAQAAAGLSVKETDAAMNTIDNTFGNIEKDTGFAAIDDSIPEQQTTADVTTTMLLAVR